MIKAVFFDMDGTLVAYPEGEIPQSAKDALEKLRKKGILVCAATGRHRVEMESIDYLKDVPFDAVASLNGQYCYTEQEDLFSNLLSPEDVQTFFTAYNYPCVVSEKGQMYINYTSQGFQKAMDHFATELPPQGNLNGIEEREILQLQVFCNEKEAQAIDNALSSARTVRWSPDFIDLIPKSGGKTFGIEAILKHFQITWEEVMAFGDGENDIEMLKAAKIGIAMGNADEKVKSIADDITEDAANDGVALGIEKYFFKE